MLYANEWETTLNRKHTVARGARVVRVEITATNIENGYVLKACSYEHLDREIKAYNDGITASIWSDMYKDCFGIRPHHKYEWFAALSDADKAAEMKSLSDLIALEVARG